MHQLVTASSVSRFWHNMPTTGTKCIFSISVQQAGSQGRAFQTVSPATEKHRQSNVAISGAEDTLTISRSTSTKDVMEFESKSNINFFTNPKSNEFKDLFTLDSNASFILFRIDV